MFRGGARSRAKDEAEKRALLCVLVSELGLVVGCCAVVGFGCWLLCCCWVWLLVVVLDGVLVAVVSLGAVLYWIDWCTTTQQHTCVPHQPLTSHHTTTQPTQTPKQTSAEEAGGAGEVRVQDPPGVRALLAGRTGACLARLLGPCVDVWIRGGCIVRRAGRRQH